MIQICNSLSQLHELKRPVIVRDLKPSNILYDSSDPPKFFLGDFGISIRIKALSTCALACGFLTTSSLAGNQYQSDADDCQTWPGDIPVHGCV